jgi:hypothetical protein
MANGSERHKKGSLPPFLGLTEAIRLVQEIYAQGGGTANYNLLSRIFDNSPSSSSFTKKLSWLKAYGLITETSKGTVSLSDTGTMIAAPQSPEVAANAKKDAFLRIDVYNRIFQRHKGKLLPADEFLRNIIEQDSAIPKQLSDLWMDSFKDAIRVAGLLYDRGDQKKQILESAMVERPTDIASASVAKNEKETFVSHSIDAVVQKSVTEPTSTPGLNVTMQLSGGQVAIFRIPDKLTSRDAQRLKGTLEGFGSVIDSLINEEE